MRASFDRRLNAASEAEARPAVLVCLYSSTGTYNWVLQWRAGGFSNVRHRSVSLVQSHRTELQREYNAELLQYEPSTVIPTATPTVD
jgi:hypothetical protein